MPEQQSGYRQIMKATSIFGGVKVLQIIISIIRSKFIAVLLGPVGMGISGLLTATLGMIDEFTSLGLSTSAVKDISAAYSSGNRTRVSIIVTVFRRLVWVTGLVGVVITAVLSPWLSELAFGNRDYTFAFILISITLLMNQLSAGHGVLLRGMRQIRSLAKSSALGSFIGLITTVPLYYYFGIKGIVPGIIVTAISSLLINWYYARKLAIEPIRVTRIRTVAEVKGMLKLGFMISLSGLITLGVSYIVRIYISNTGGVDQVGLYNAGFALVNTYVGMVFIAMSTDYYPRLSSIADNNEQCSEAINQQAEIAVLILAPIIMVFLVFINWVIILLYSAKFIPINNMILYAVLGMFFKAASWSIAMIFLAKGASKLFFWNELVTNIYLLALNLIGYKYWGLTGLGVSFLISYILYLIQVYIVSALKYDFKFSKEFYRLFALQLLLAVICLIIVKFTSHPWSYVFGSLLIVGSSFHVYKELDKRIGIKQFINSKLNKF